MKKSKHAGLILLAGAMLPVFSHAGELDPIAHYPIANVYGDEPFAGAVHDFSDNKRDGEVHGPKMTLDWAGGNDGAYWFDGTDNYINLPATEYTAFSGDFTVAFYQKSCAAGQKVAISLGSENKKSLVFKFDSTSGSEIIVNGKSYFSGDVGEFSDGRFHHILLRRAGSNVELFIDTKKQWSKNISGLIGSKSDFRVSGDIHPWNGAIDDIKIYTRALDDGEISPLAFDGAPQSKGPWTLATCDAAFKRRDGAGALTFNGKMWLLGGWNPSSSDGWGSPNDTSFTSAGFTSNEVWSSVNGADWNLETIAPWPERHMAGWAVFKGKMWVVAGDNNSGITHNDVWWSSDGKNWHEIKGDFGWKDRILYHVEVFNNKLWIMGGQRQLIPSNNPADYLNDVWSSSDGKTWRLETEHAAWSPRGIITGSAVFKNKMWLIAGGIYDEKLYKDIYSSSDGRKWTKVTTPPAPFPERYYHDVHVMDGKLWLTGGYRWHKEGGDYDLAGNLNDVYFSADGAHWTQVANTDWLPRHGNSVWVFGKDLYVGAGNLWNDVWKLTPSSAAFKELNTYYRDRDRDGFGDPNLPILAKEPSPLGAREQFVLDKTDCNDYDANVNPSVDGSCDYSHAHKSL